MAFKVLAQILLAACAVTSYYVGQEVILRNKTIPNYHTHIIDYLLIAMNTFGFLSITLALRRYILYPIAWCLVIRDPKWTGEVYQFRIQRCCNSILNFGFYIFLTLALYPILKDKNFMPTYLGGSGQLKNAWDANYPYTVPDIKIKEFYLVQIGFHIAETINHMFSKQRTDFYEMILHHVATIGLVAFSYSMNYLNFGILIMFLHNVSDIFVYMCKMTSDTSFKHTTSVNFILTVSAWIYFRMYVFGGFMIPSAYNNVMLNWNTSLAFMTGVLIVLQGLHIWWLYLMLRIAYNIVFLDIREDIIEQYVEKKRRKKSRKLD